MRPSTVLSATLTAVCLAGVLAGPLLAQEVPSRIANLAPETDRRSSNPRRYFEAGGQVFFSGQLPGTGTELFVTDGTEGGTRLVRDVHSGTEGAQPGTYAVLGTGLFFVPQRQEYGREPWFSDGTPEGTVRIRDIAPGTADSASTITSVTLGDVVLFPAFTESTGFELWKTDGTAAGTVQVADVALGAGHGSPQELTRVGNRVFFTADDATTGRELWVTDGTEGGTRRVADLNGGPDGSTPQVLTAVGNRLFFSADDGVNDREAFVSDGTALGTVRVSDLNSGGFGGPGFFAALGNDAVFSIFDGIDQRVYFTNGTPEDAVLLSPDALSVTGVDGRFTSTGTQVFFNARTAAAGSELWVTDGTPDGTTMVTDLRAGTSGSNPNRMVVLDGVAYFAATTDDGGNELWRSDGTQIGTTRVKDVRPGPDSSTPFALLAAGGSLYFTANDGTTGFEPWISDGTEAGTHLVANVAPDDADSGVFDFFALGENVVFTVDQDATGAELWVSDGTDAGTHITRDVAPGAAGSQPRSFARLGGRVLFSARDETGRGGLWATDGTDPGTVLVADLNPTGQGDGGSSTGNLATFLGRTYFAGYDGINSEPWVSDGSAAGTMQFLDLRDDRSASQFRDLTPVGTTLFFTARDDVTNDQLLWRTDGTPGGSSYVVDPDGGDPPDNPHLLTRSGSELFFIGRAVDGDQVWRTDGSEAGTTELTTLFSPSPQIEDIHPFGGEVAFLAGEELFPRDLYVTDRTAPSGHRKLTDFDPAGIEGAGRSSFEDLVTLDDRIVFNVFTQASGQELWTSDGTALGTGPLADVAPGSTGSVPSALTALPGTGHALFAATSGTDGEELWITDGTAEGTRRVADLNPGPQSSSPRTFTPARGRVYFTAVDGTGREPWSVTYAFLGIPETLLDADGDTFPDELEGFAVTDPDLPGDHPLGSAAVTPKALSLKKVKVGLRFDRADKDSLLVKGGLPVPQGFDPTGVEVLVDFGSVLRRFTLNAKGKSTPKVKGGDSFSISLKRKGGVVAANEAAKFSLKLRKASLAVDLADDKLTAEAGLKKAPRTVRLLVVWDGALYRIDVDLAYTVDKRARKGRGKS